MNLIENPQGWLRDYHQRSNVEATYSTLKRDFQTPLRKRIKKRRGVEKQARICDYNLKRLCYIHRLEEISIHWKAS